MKLNKKIFASLLLPLLLLSSQPVIAEPIKINELPLEKQVEFLTLVYGGDAELNKKIIKCESGWNTTANGDGGRSKGIAQIQKPTWDWMEKQFYQEYGEHLNYESSFDQIKILVYQVNRGNGRHWTAYRAIKNGGVYSFYSKQLKKHFTITCK